MKKFLAAAILTSFFLIPIGCDDKKTSAGTGTPPAPPPGPAGSKVGGPTGPKAAE